MRTLSAAVVILVLILAGAPPAPAQSNTPTSATWTTDEAVRAMVRTSTTLYLGGSFTYVGPVTGAGVPISTVTGKPAPFPRVDTNVYASAPDGSGGWFIGGDFTRVGGQPRNNIAHVLADGRLDPNWNPGADGSISKMVVAGGKLYVTGFFTNIGGQPRNHLASLDIATSSVTAWNPNPNGTSLVCLTASDSTLYMIGNFSSIGGQTRSSLAAFDLMTGALKAWAPGPFNDGGPSVMVVSGGVVYIGGIFSNVASMPRYDLAAVDAVTGAILPWNPGGDPDYSYGVSTLAVDNGVVYAGGSFRTIGGQPRNRLAAIDAASGAVLPWDPNPRGCSTSPQSTNINVLVASGSTVYVGGQFSHIGGKQRSYIAALDGVTGVATDWNPGTNKTIFNLTLSGSTLFAGGRFTSAGGVTRNCLAALDIATGAPTNWNPDARGKVDPWGYEYTSVNALALSGSTLYAGGDFTTVSATARNRLVAIDTVTGALKDWNPDASGAVYALALSGSTLYAGGYFTTVNATTRNRLAAIDTATGAVKAWNPDTSGTVRTLALAGSTLYAGGSFSHIGGQERRRLAAIDTVSGVPTTWNPIANGTVNALAVSSSTVYAGGAFSTVGGQTRHRLAAIDAASGIVTAWDTKTSSTYPEINALALRGSTLYAAGWWWSPRGSLTGWDTATGLATAWDPNSYGTIRSIEASGPAVYVGGQWTRIANEQRYCFAQFDFPLPAQLTPSPVALYFLEGSPWAVDVEHGGAPATRTVTLTNTGGQPLNFTGGAPGTPGLKLVKSWEADFSIQNVTPSTAAPLAPGASVTVTIRFAPQTSFRTLGIGNALVVTSDSPVAPEFTVPLLGDAVPVGLSGFAVE